MKYILSLIVSGVLVVSGFGQTRNVLVGTNNAVVQPTNFWSADASNARTGLGLGTAATNPASAFQPSSVALSNFSSGTFTAEITNGGTGATNAATARTNLGLGFSALTNTDANSFRTAIGLGTNNSPRFIQIVMTSSLTGPYQTVINPFATTVSDGGTNSVTIAPDGIFFSNVATANTRTNLGLGASWLTNSNTPVFVDTNGSVVSPTNFWQAAPITTTFIETQPVANQTTNIAAARNLHIHSLAISTTGVTNTIALPTNGATFDGDIALVVHQGPTSSVTAVRTAGASTNLITLNQVDEAVEFVYYNNVWQFNHNQSFVEPIYFSGTNATVNAAASRTNLGLGGTNSVTFGEVSAGYMEVVAGTNSVEIQSDGIGFVGESIANTRTNLGLPLAALTNTNNVNFRTAIELGSTNNVSFSNVTASGTLTATGVVTAVTNLNVGGAIAVTNAAATRTNLGLGGGITTNLILKNGANVDTYMNFSNGILIYGSTVAP